MDYRSLSFHQGWPDPELIELGASVGFNDVCFQTEKGTLGPLVDLRERGEERGYFELLDELGMTTSVWAHELEDYVSAWGDAEAGNDHLLEGVRRRYEHVAGELFPDLDYLVLTVVESEIWVTDADLLAELVGAVHGACHSTDTELVFRTFVWHPEDEEAVAAALGELPEDVIVQTKYVPQDWHRRSIDHPLLGDVGGRRQFVEVDVAGEYYRMDHVCHAFTDDLAERFERWVDAGVEGLSVRVDRGWVPHEYQNAVLGEAQEANLWALGALAAGWEDDLDAIWEAYATERFGEAAADAMERALRPTGDVIAEGLCVGHETFGDTRKDPPAIRTFEAAEPRRYDDAEAESTLECDPFNRHWAVFRWDQDYLPAYHRTRRGHPDVIAQKEAALEDARETADECLAALAEAAPHLPEGAKTFFEFKLAENRYHLDVMGHAALAWLRQANRLYHDEGDPDRVADRVDVAAHLAELESLAGRHEESVTCEWLGETHELHRGEYVSPARYVEEFRTFWDLD